MTTGYAPADGRYAVGLEEIDAEHALQFKLLGVLEQELGAGNWGAAAQIAKQLYDYSEVHFGSEQVLMRLHSYPAYLAHEREHGELLDELRGLLDSINAERAYSFQPAAFRRWLSGHVHSSDRAFESYVRAAPLSAG